MSGISIVEQPLIAAKASKFIKDRDNIIIDLSLLSIRHTDGIRVDNMFDGLLLSLKAHFTSSPVGAVSRILL